MVAAFIFLIDIFLKHFLALWKEMTSWNYMQIDNLPKQMLAADEFSLGFQGSDVLICRLSQFFMSEKPLNNIYYKNAFQ